MTEVPTSVDELTAAVESGRAVKYLFFWGHRPQRDGSTGSGCLSQWWPAPFTVDGTPSQAKALGRQVRGFEQHTWERNRFGIVVDGSVAKFDQHQPLREFLLGTGERVLVEASPVDRVWGIGLPASDERAVDPAAWRGLNLLGFALMRARQLLG
jgi:predicted NAD-dependent protein-ADP-ribosyltransferase YbiA (DUF1768 family)